MFPKKVARTYLGRRRRETVPEASKKIKEHGFFIDLDSTGDYSFPIDPFDKLTTKDADQRVQLKELEKIHASFNLDSSVETSRHDITGPDRSSTPLRNSVGNRKAQVLDYSHLFDSPTHDETSIYTRFIPSEPSSNTVDASKVEMLDSIETGITSTPTANLKKNVGKLSLSKQRKHVKIKEKSLEISPLVKNKSAQAVEVDNVSKPKVLSPVSAINQNSDKITTEHKNVRKLSLTKARNVCFNENLIEISEDSANYNMPELNNARLSKQKRKTKSSNAKLIDNEPSLRKSTRLSNRKSEKISNEPLVPSETNNGCDKLILAGGKWRKSLNAWKRRTVESQINNLDSRSTNQMNHNHRMSIKILDGATQRDLQTIVEQLQNSLSESPIVLQETDDGLSNLSGLSLRDESDSGRNILRQRSLIYENQFNEESDNNKTYKQSLLRKRCTSVIEPPTFDHHLDITTCVTAIDIVKKLNPKEIVLRRCRQIAPLKFSEIYSEQNLHNCRKIGEGVYGEVFMNKTACGNTAVLKIIPIEGEIEVNGEPQKKFDEILAEIVIAMELSNLRNGKDFMTNGFVEVINVRCVQGRYPEHLVDLWELYRDNHVTENDHPDIFNDDQLFIVLELSNAGQDLEAFTFSNALQSYSAFIQIAITLAVAEAKFQFEHRDLHWGNVLLIPTDDKEITFKLNGKETKIPTHGVKATIIDYTLSRMVFEGCCLYNDLSNDDELFAASGDYQFDIYRFMKNHLGNKWDRYEPYTNILWLHYTIDKMINGARYRNNKNKKHRSAIQDMMQLRDELLDYKNSCDYIKCLC